MILLFIIVIIVLTVIYTFLRLNNDNKNQETFVSNKKKNRQLTDMSNKRNFIENMMAFPNKQKYCPNLYNFKAKVWSRLPPKYGKGLFVKYNCTVCYYKIMRSIICRKNQGKYKIGKLNKSDLDNFKIYYEKHKKKLDFEYDRSKFEKYLGKSVLKYKKNGVYYPVQILKKRSDMDYKDIIEDDCYRTDFNCKKINKKNKKEKTKEKIDDESSESESSESESSESESNKNDSNNNESSDENEDIAEKKKDGVFSFFDLL